MNRSRRWLGRDSPHGGDGTGGAVKAYGHQSPRPRPSGQNNRASQSEATDGLAKGQKADPLLLCLRLRDEKSRDHHHHPAAGYAVKRACRPLCTPASHACPSSSNKALDPRQNVVDSRLLNGSCVCMRDCSHSKDGPAGGCTLVGMHGTGTAAAAFSCGCVHLHAAREWSLRLRACSAAFQVTGGCGAVRSRKATTGNRCAG